MNFNELTPGDQASIHDTLWEAGLIKFDEENTDKIAILFNCIPEHLKSEGSYWGFSDSVVRDNIYSYFLREYKTDK